MKNGKSSLSSVLSHFFILSPFPSCSHTLFFAAKLLKDSRVMGFFVEPRLKRRIYVKMRAC